MKEMMKALCLMSNEMYKAGCLRAGGDGNAIHLTNDAFRALFAKWQVEQFNDVYDRWYVVEDGFEFFTLVEF